MLDLDGMDRWINIIWLGTEAVSVQKVQKTVRCIVLVECARPRAREQRSLACFFHRQVE
jgi:hypothetical protein